MWSIIIIILLFLYEFLLAPKICKRMIYKHIDDIGGSVIEIERLTLKEYLYCVNYNIGGKVEKSIVQFNIFFRSTWK
jgi:hypothetical protein